MLHAPASARCPPPLLTRPRVPPRHTPKPPHCPLAKAPFTPRPRSRPPPLFTPRARPPRRFPPPADPPAFSRRSRRALSFLLVNTSRRLGCSLGSGLASSARGSPSSSYARTSMTCPPPPPSPASPAPSSLRQSASPSVLPVRPSTASSPPPARPPPPLARRAPHAPPSAISSWARRSSRSALAAASRTRSRHPVSACIHLSSSPLLPLLSK